MAIKTGGPGNDNIIGTNKADVILLGEGSDQTNARGGNDVVFGDKAEATEFIVLGTSDTAMETVSFDDDVVLDGGNGVDIIYGDTVTVKFEATAVGSNGATISVKTINFGSEEMSTSAPNAGLFGDANNDTLYGDLDSISLVANGSDLNAGAGQALVSRNTFIFGADSLSGGTGSDVLYGDLNSITLIANGGDANSGSRGGQASVNFNSFIFGADTLSGGEGNDVLDNTSKIPYLKVLTI